MPRRSRFAAACALLAALSPVFLSFLPRIASAAPPSAMKTARGGQDISRIHVTAVYYLPPGRIPVPDWEQRVAYLLDRMARFHEREFAGQSRVTWEIDPRILVPENHAAPTVGYQWFWDVVTRVREKQWRPDDAQGFPVLVVFTETNVCAGCTGREWSRTCDPARCTCQPHDGACDGNRDKGGEDHPGSKCGGSQAVYWAEEKCGAAIVSGDAWKVPLKGSDCVAYHEALGHVLGLPHPEPMDDSVMGRAQYSRSLAEAVLDDDQKAALGWRPAAVPRNDLFSAFGVSHAPADAQVGQVVTLTATLPGRGTPDLIAAQYQAGDLRAPWVTLPPPRVRREAGRVVCEWTVPAQDAPRLVSYRVAIPDGKRGWVEQRAVARWK
jgi:hypothetical protein